MPEFDEKEILLMIWQTLEDFREYNSNLLTDAQGWHANSENTDKRSSSHQITDAGKALRKSKVCLKYIEKKLKEIQ